MPNSATHLRVGIMSWFEFNEMEKRGPSNFIHVNPTQTHWTSPLPDFPLQRNIESVVLFSLFFHFVSKGPNRFGTLLRFTLRLTANVKSGVENFIWKKKEGEKKCFLFLHSSLWSWRTFDSTAGINAVTLKKNKNKAYLCIRGKPCEEGFKLDRT